MMALKGLIKHLFIDLIVDRQYGNPPLGLCWTENLVRFDVLYSYM